MALILSPIVAALNSLEILFYLYLLFSISILFVCFLFKACSLRFNSIVDITGCFVVADRRNLGCDWFEEAGHTRQKKWSCWYEWEADDGVSVLLLSRIRKTKLKLEFHRDFLHWKGVNEKMTATARTTPHIIDMIGWMSEKSRAARAARFLVQFFDVVCQMTTFWRRREVVAVICLYIKTISVIKGMNTSPILYNMSIVEKFHIAKSSSVLEWHFRCSSRCMFINSLLGNLSNHDYDGNKNLTNLHIWQWKTVFLHVHFFSSFDISQTFSFFLRREMTCFAVVWTTWSYDDKC